MVMHCCELKAQLDLEQTESLRRAVAEFDLEAATRFADDPAILLQVYLVSLLQSNFDWDSSSLSVDTVEVVAK